MSVLDEKITFSLVNNYLPCPVAFDISKEVKVSRRQVGDAANRLKVRVSDCQLGCFDTRKATHEKLADKKISKPVIETVEASAIDGRIPCLIAFKIADTLHVLPREVGDAATQQNIKIKHCQLGCFP
ncbi:hypothetical protein ACFLVH_03500 [Chloroflexota bacterium]